jgi:hypothetical protein
MNSTPGSTDCPRVFISYAQESEAHIEQVRKFGTLLRELGIDAQMDQWHAHERRDWSQWAIEQLDKADFVIAVASPAFRNRADGTAPSHEGRGAQFEGAILRNRMTQDRTTWIRRILPVVLPENTVDNIPEFLLPYSATHYVIEDLTPDGILELRRTLLRQSAHPLPPLCKPAPLPPEESTSSTSRPAQRGGQTINVNHSSVGNFVAGDYHDNGGSVPHGR